MAGTSEAKGRVGERRSRGGRLALADLRQAVQTADPAAILVPPRILRRVVRECHDLPGLRLRISHRKCYVIARERLLEIADRDDMELSPDDELPDRVTLVPLPDQARLDDAPAGTILVFYWRLLFHAAIHTTLDRRLASGEITRDAIDRWIGRIGATEFDEARSVLDQEGFLLPPIDDVGVFVEFAAVYLELACFARGMLSRYFPAIEQPEVVAEVLAEAVDARPLLAATRPPGAPGPGVDPELVDLERIEPDAESQPLQAEPLARGPSERKYQRWARRAESAQSRGNVVREVLCWHQARRVAPKARVGLVRNAARKGLDLLIQRMRAALGLDEDDPLRWREPLAVLAEQASRGIWTREGRLLYDLQKICIDHERNVFKIDLAAWLRGIAAQAIRDLGGFVTSLARHPVRVGMDWLKAVGAHPVRSAAQWVRSLARRPIKRALPSQRDVLMVRHLQTALRRLAAVRLSDGQRQELYGLLRGATDRCEARLREQFRPVIDGVLDEVGLTPQNVPETVARGKIVEELLDLVVERGFLRMGDLRDALARNDLKLPDVAGLGNVLAGDQLLRADRRLAARMDGVHRPGEFYLRWLQRLSALGFGTHVGRLLTLFAVVPFGGAFVILVGLMELVGMITGDKRRIEDELDVLLPATFVLGAFLLGLVNFPRFRAAVWRGLKAAFRGTRMVLVDLPWRLVRSPLVQAVLQSRWWKLGYRLLLKPAVLTAVVCLLLYGRHYAVKTEPATAAAIFLAVSLLLNSRLGRDMEEISQEWAVSAWQRLGLQAFARLFSFVMEISQVMVEGLERLLYTVDEWLRFRSGQGRGVFVVKAVLGMFWAGVTYVVRFAVTLLIEPQVNPVKHFPVVTVSHKLLLWFIPHLASVFSLTMPEAVALTLAGAIITSIPGIFGFLVWELRTNWRLYAANRPPQLGAVPIGHHGETMLRFLRPGFHSGTIPKRFARLRRAERAARKKGSWAGVRKHLRKLHEVEESIRRFLERETAALIAQAACWKDASLEIGRVHLATNRVRFELRPARAEGGLRVAFDMRGGWLVADAADGAWVAGLSAGQKAVLRAALLGVFKRAGSDLASRQIDERLAGACAAWDLDRRGLVVRPNGSSGGELVYALASEGPLVPEPSADGPADPAPRVYGRAELLFSAQDIAWEDWVRFWDGALSGDDVSSEALAPVPVLP